MHAMQRRGGGHVQPAPAGSQEGRRGSTAARPGRDTWMMIFTLIPLSHCAFLCVPLSLPVPLTEWLQVATCDVPPAACTSPPVNVRRNETHTQTQTRQVRREHEEAHASRGLQPVPL